MFVTVTSLLNKILDVFLHKLIQFYSNNVTNLHHLTSQYAVLPHNPEIVALPQISPCVCVKTYVRYWVASTDAVRYLYTRIASVRGGIMRGFLYELVRRTNSVD